MSSYSLFLDVFDIDDPDKELDDKKAELVYRSKLLDDLEQIASQRADYYTSGTAATARLQKANVEAKLKAIKLYADTQVSIENISSRERSKAISDLSRAASRLQTSARRIEEQITPERGRIQQILTRGSQAKTTVAQELSKFLGNPYDNETGTSMSDEKLHATLLQLGEEEGFFTVEGGKIILDPRLNASQATADALVDTLNTTRIAYDKAKARQRQSEDTARKLLQGANQLREGANPNAVRTEIIDSTRDNLNQLTASIGDARSLREQRDILIQDDAAIKGLDDVQRRIERELDRISGTKDQSQLKNIIANPKFRLWAEMHGYNIGTVDDKGNYIPNQLVDKGAVLHFGLQQRTGLDFRVNRKGRTVRLKDEGGFTVDPLDSFDVSDAERAVVQGLRAGTVEAFRVDDVGLVFKDKNTGKHTLLTDADGTFKDLPDSSAQTLENIRNELGDSERAELMNEGKTQADALLQKYPVTQEVGEQEYREITPNARDIQRGKVRLQSLTTGEIVERDIDGYRDSIEVIESMAAGPGDVIRAARDARLERRGKRAAGIEIVGEEDFDLTGREIVSVERREGEGGLQDQLDEARKELEEAGLVARGASNEVEAAQTALNKAQADFNEAQAELDASRADLLGSLNPGMILRGEPLDIEKRRERVIEARESIKEARKVLEREKKAVEDVKKTAAEPLAREVRARRSAEQLDAKIEDSLAKAGTRAEEAVGDEPALDPVPVFDSGEARPKQLEGDTSAELLEASARQLAEPVPEDERPESPVADTLIKAEDVQPMTTGIAARTKAADETGTRDPSYQTKFQRFLQGLRQLRSGPENIMPEENIKTRAPRSPSTGLGGEVITPPVVRDSKTGAVLGPSIMTEEAVAELKKRRAERAKKEDEDFRLEGEPKTASPDVVDEPDFGLPEGAMRTGGLTPEQRGRMASGITEEGLKRSRR